MFNMFSWEDGGTHLAVEDKEQPGPQPGPHGSANCQQTTAAHTSSASRPRPATLTTTVPYRAQTESVSNPP